MTGYWLTTSAHEDIERIWLAIGLDNPDAADQLYAEFYSAFRSLSTKPDLGHWRRDLTDRPVRFFLVHRQYLIIYDPVSSPLTIIRVFHGSRDISTELNRDQ